MSFNIRQKYQIFFKKKEKNVKKTIDCLQSVKNDAI